MDEPLPRSACPFRVGIGHDTHRLGPGGPLRLGGIDVPHDLHAVGHSDADVLLHAVTDALLGAAALGDIGGWFPDTDPAHRGRDSVELLIPVVEAVHAAGYRVVNLDCIIFAQRPKLVDYKDGIRQRLAGLLKVPADCIGVKAKTGERVGPIGREEAIEAQAVVLLERIPMTESSTVPRKEKAMASSSTTVPSHTKIAGAHDSRPSAASKVSSPPEPLAQRQPAMTLRVYSTLSKTKDTFEPLVPGKVGIYLCGPTVYKPSHIGHMVGPVIFDCITRYLRYSGYDVTLVVNVTDVDDKLIKEANARGLTMGAVAEEMTADYMNNLAAMGVDTINHFPKATDHIDEIIKFNEELIALGFAYASEGDVYFDVAKNPSYGKLSGRTLESMQGEGGSMASRKHSPQDFALWKAAKPGEPSWPSPWGDGRPGWHIECSAMSRKILGKTFDIHGGGLDLAFPHHENEICQSECCHGAPQAKYWLHNGLMQASTETGKVGGRSRSAQAAGEAPVVDAADQASQEAGKMGKSKGASAFRDLLAKFPGETIRFFLLATHYRSPIDYGEERIQEVGAGLDGFYRFFQRYERVTIASFYKIPVIAKRADGEFDPAGDEFLQEVATMRRDFLAAMDDDFNTGGARGLLFDLLKSLNRFVEKHRLDEPGTKDTAALAKFEQGTKTLRELGALFGLFQKPVIASKSGEDELAGKVLDVFVELRKAARAAKNFALGDAIRNGLTELGVTLEDRASGTVWTVKGSTDGLTDKLLGRIVEIRKQVRAEKNYAMSDEIRNRIAATGIVLEDRAGETTWILPR